MRASLVCLVIATFASSVALAKPLPEKFPGATLPDVTRVQDKLGARSGVEERGAGTVVIASPKQIVVGNKSIVSITNGTVDPAEKEGGSAGNKIGKLEAAVPGSDPVVLGIDRSLSYKLLFEMIYSTKNGRSNYQVLVMAGGAVAAIPIALPTKPLKDDLKIVVSASKTEVLVWSISGKEGTLKKPKLRVALDDSAGENGRTTAAIQVRTTLETIAKRWKGKKRPEATQSILLQADGATSMQFVAELMVAMRPQFANISLSAGFE